MKENSENVSSQLKCVDNALQDSVTSGRSKGLELWRLVLVTATGVWTESTLCHHGMTMYGTRVYGGVKSELKTGLN